MNKQSLSNNEQAEFVKAEQQKELIKYCRASLKSINSDLEKVNQQIARLIETDEHLKESHGRPRLCPDDLYSGSRQRNSY